MKEHIETEGIYILGYGTYPITEIDLPLRVKFFWIWPVFRIMVYSYDVHQQGNSFVKMVAVYSDRLLADTICPVTDKGKGGHQRCRNFGY